VKSGDTAARAADSEHGATVYPPRIIKITYRSAVNGRVAVAYAKVPYSQLYDLSEKLARLVATRNVRWFRIDAATPAEIGANRQTATRWPDALAATITRTHIDVLA
jgi:hypothetical protein